jgi:SPP1 family predicted phage head-tail adaptor
MRAGRLRHRVTFQNKVETQDAKSLEIIATFEDFAALIAAEIAPLKGADLLLAQQYTEALTTGITVRALDVVGVTGDMRILHPATGLIYHIISIKADPSLMDSVLFLCESGVNAG